MFCAIDARKTSASSPLSCFDQPCGIRSDLQTEVGLCQLEMYDEDGG